MSQPLAINEEYWLGRNPNIEFRKVRKAFYGTHLLKARLRIVGATARFTHHQMAYADRVKNPNYEQFMQWLIMHVQRFNMQKLTRTVDNRYLHTSRDIARIHSYRGYQPQDRIYDAKALYALHTMLRSKPQGMRFSRQNDYLHIYSNDADTLRMTIDSFYIEDSDIEGISFPAEDEIEALVAGKEYSVKADRYRYKVFLKSALRADYEDVLNYLESIKDTGDVEVPMHCRQAMAVEKVAWQYSHGDRSYFYAKDEGTVLLVKLLAGSLFSTCIELILPESHNDK